MTSEIDLGDSGEITTTSMSTTNQVIQETRPASFVLEESESEEDIVQTMDDAGNTNQFIAEGLHEIASEATRTVLLGY